MFYQVIFWFSIIAILYTYILYPVFLLALSSVHQIINDVRFLLKKNDRRICNTAITHIPKVAVIIAAYNEEQDIEQRIINILDQNYPPDRLSVYVGSDGSTDRTADIIRKFEDIRVNKFIFDKNRGKITVLNDLIANTTCEDILVLTDANTHFNKDVIEKLVRHFDNPNVGAVCGELNLVDGKSNQNKDGFYWKYERVLKYYEGRIGALLGANGANYAIRRNLYKALPINTIVDDFTIVMDIALDGMQVKYDPEAIAIETIAPDIKEEFKRRVRIGIGNYQAFSRYIKFLLPKFSALYFCYISHKVFRWFVPHFMAAALFSNVFLINYDFYYYTFVLQLAVYIGFILSYFIKKSFILPNVIMFPFFLISMNLALGIGFLKYITGNFGNTWKRTKRS